MKTMLQFAIGVCLLHLTCSLSPLPADEDSGRVAPSNDRPANSQAERKKLGQHLSQVNAGLDAVQTRRKWREHAYQPSAIFPSLDQVAKNLRDARQFPQIRHGADLVDDAGQLSDQLRIAESMVSAFKNPASVTEDQLSESQAVRGLFKQIGRNLNRTAELAKGSDVDSPTVPGVPGKERGARMVEPVLDPPTGRTRLNEPISNVLMQLYLLDQTKRMELSRRIVEDENTKVVSNQVRRVRGLPEPVVDMIVQRTTPTPDGGSTTVKLHLSKYLQQVNTDGVANKFSILTQSNSKAGLIIWIIMHEEAPVGDALSISRYNACLTLFGSDDGKATEITFTPDVELTVYDKCGTRLRDVAYRAAVKSKFEQELVDTQEGTLQRTSNFITELLHPTTRLANQVSESK